MAPGFVLDRDSNSSNKASRWIEGPPEKHWYGLKIRGKAQFEVTTFRCPRCGFLESYAPD
jgi:hypothetical protein